MTPIVSILDHRTVDEIGGDVTPTGQEERGSAHQDTSMQAMQRCALSVKDVVALSASSSATICSHSESTTVARCHGCPKSGPKSCIGVRII